MAPCPQTSINVYLSFKYETYLYGHLKCKILTTQVSNTMPNKNHQQKPTNVKKLQSKVETGSK